MKNGDADDIDLREYVQEHIPEVSFGLLNRETRNSYNESKKRYNLEID